MMQHENDFYCVACLALAQMNLDEHVDKLARIVGQAVGAVSAHVTKTTYGDGLGYEVKFNTEKFIAGVNFKQERAIDPVSLAVFLTHSFYQMAQLHDLEERGEI